MPARDAGVAHGEVAGDRPADQEHTSPGEGDRLVSDGGNELQGQGETSGRGGAEQTCTLLQIAVPDDPGLNPGSGLCYPAARQGRVAHSSRGPGRRPLTP